MKVITLYISCFLYFILCTLSMADVVPRRYTVEPSLDNKVSNNSIMTKHHSESLIQCGVKCGEICACFGFNPQLKKCRIHQSCDSSELTDNETGWRYYNSDGDSAGDCWGLYQKGHPRSADLGVDCWELYEKGHNQSGVYQINPTGVSCHTISVYCDMETSGGGWTVIQKREDGSTDFYRNWTDYKRGFGEPSQNYWIGNDAIHALSKINQELRVDVESFDRQAAYALYSEFKVGNESTKYRLTVGGYSGTAGDSLTYCNGCMFSTWDQDSDEYGGNCAFDYHGAWWYKMCAYSNLNGQNVGYAFSGHKYQFWHAWKSLQALNGTKMMIRPKT